MWAKVFKERCILLERSSFLSKAVQHMRFPFIFRWTVICGYLRIGFSLVSVCVSIAWKTIKRWFRAKVVCWWVQRAGNSKHVCFTAAVHGPSSCSFCNNHRWSEDLSFHFLVFYSISSDYLLLGPIFCCFLYR